MVLTNYVKPQKGFVAHYKKNVIDKDCVLLFVPSGDSEATVIYRKWFNPFGGGCAVVNTITTNLPSGYYTIAKADFETLLEATLFQSFQFSRKRNEVGNFVYEIAL